MPTESFECPFCGTNEPPREEPKGTWCSNPKCKQKIEGCCTGSPLPAKRTNVQ